MNFKELKYYDFVVRTAHFSRTDSYAYRQIKLPAKDLKSAILGYICMIDPPLEYTTPEIFSRKYFSISDAESVAYLFFQVIEFDLVKVRGKTVMQYKEINIYNRHDFLCLFDRAYNIKI